MKPTDNKRNNLKHLALALALGVGLGGSAQAQTTIEVGGVGVIGDTNLTTGSLPDNGDNWSVDGEAGGTIKFSGLVSPTVVVANDGVVTLTFDHRYDFEATGDPWDGGAVFVSVNGAAFTYVPLASFSANGYVGPTTANAGSAWETNGEDVFYGNSAGYATPVLIQSVASLGSLLTGDTVAVEFRGGWDNFGVNGPPAWEIGTVDISDTGAQLLGVDFTADGPSDFTIANIGVVTEPWEYLTAISAFEIDAATDTADRYVPAVPASVIDLNDVNITVTLLAGTLVASDSFTLFDLTTGGASTLTGSLGSVSLPLGTWDTSLLETTGVITYLAAPTDTLHTATGGSHDNDTWNTPGSWDNGVPTGTIDVTIGAGNHASANSSKGGPTGPYTGDLILEAGSTLELGGGSTAADLGALGTGSWTFMDGAEIRMRYSTNSFHSNDIVMMEDGRFALGQSTSAHNKQRTLSGVISGPGLLTIHSTNGNRLFLSGTNTWTGGLLAGGSESENKKETIEADATKSLGEGDVTIETGVSLQIDAVDAMGDSATLSLSGKPRSDSSTKLVMSADDTVDQLVLDGFSYPLGTYGATGSAATNQFSWVTGAGILTVTSETDPGSLPVTIAEAPAGGSTTDVLVGEPVVYTVSFGGPTTMALTAGDLSNSTATAITIESIIPIPNALADTTAYWVTVTADEVGTLKMQVTTAFQDLFGNASVSTLAPTLFNVNPVTLEGELGVWKQYANNGINPSTGVAWVAGDQYRLAFHTLNKFDADSSDPAVHNARVNTEAQLSTLGNGSITVSTGWTAMITTTTTGVKANTGTDVAGGFPVYAMDGSSCIARDNADIWNGWSNPFATDPTGLTGNSTLRLASGSTNPNSGGNAIVASQGVYNSPFLTQFGLGDSATVHGVTTWTGNNHQGTVTATKEVGSVAGNTGTGSSNANNSTRVYQRGNSNHLTNFFSFYALSGPLTVQVPGAGGPDDYSTWQALNGAGPALDGDHDLDGVDNGVEYFIGGPNGNTTGFTALPSVVDTAGVLTVTWPHAADYTGVYGTDYWVETSTLLTDGSWTPEATPGNVAIVGEDVIFTYPVGTANYARLVVVGP